MFDTPKIILSKACNSKSLLSLAMAQAPFVKLIAKLSLSVPFPASLTTPAKVAFPELSIIKLLPVALSSGPI